MPSVSNSEIISFLNTAFYGFDDENESRNWENNATLTTADTNFARNPLLNSVVLNRVFHHLHFHEVKTSRLVCQEWNSVASPLLRKRGTIVFKRDERGPLQFLIAFSLTNSNIAFHRFVFEEECVAREMGYFISIYGRHITSLKYDCHNVLIGQEQGQKIVARIFKNTMLPLMHNLSELHIVCRSETKQYIAIQHLVTVKTLKLEDCFLFINKTVKVAPSVLVLNNVSFIFNKRQDQCLINDAFDFNKAKDVYIDQRKSYTKILDVGQGVAKIDKLTLYSVKVENWETSQWNVENLCLDRMSLLEKITMGIKKLKMYNIGSDLRPGAFRNKLIDLSVLPATLENLSFQNELKTDFIVSDSVYLPNLKKLQIVLSLIGKPLALPYFANCPNLTNISLRGFSRQQVVLDLSCLPQSVKKLEIESAIQIIDNRINSGEPFRVNTLVLHPVAFAARASFLQKIQPEVFVLLYDGWEFKWDDIVDFVNDYSQLEKIFVRTFSTITTILERNNTFNPQNLALQQTLFYVFENQRMKAITSEEFEASVAL